LFQSVTVGSFANAVELVFDPLEGGSLLLHLGAQLAMAGSYLGQASFDGFEVDLDWGRGMCGMGLRGNQRANRGGKIAIQERQKPLYQRQSRANGINGPLESRFGSVWIYWRDRGLAGRWSRWSGSFN
jgi:hypothetical protein